MYKINTRTTSVYTCIYKITFRKCELSIDVLHKWRLRHGNEARMLFSRSILVSNYQTDMFLCLIFAKIAK